MKRNTVIALVYWLLLVVCLFLAGRAQQAGQTVIFMNLGGAYVLLSWCCLLVVKFVERRPIASLGFTWGSPGRTLLTALVAFLLVNGLATVEAWYRVQFRGEPLTQAAPVPSNLLIELVQQLLWVGLPEEIVNFGNLFGSRITRAVIALGVRL